MIAMMAFAIAFIAAVPAQAQFKFGVRAGLNISKMSFKFDGLSTDNRTGFFAGVSGEFTLPIIPLGFEASVLYDRRTVLDFNDDATGTKNKALEYIAIPINIKYSVGLGSVANVYAATGPQFSFNIGGKKLWDNPAFSYDLKKSEFYWNVGAGVRLFNHLQIGYTYNIALGNTAELSPKAVMDVVADETKKLIGGNGKTNSHQIALTYWF